MLKILKVAVVASAAFYVGVLGTTALGTVALPYATGTIRLAAASAVVVVFYCP
jgi:hypothetical protein